MSVSGRDKEYLLPLWSHVSHSLAPLPMLLMGEWPIVKKINATIMGRKPIQDKNLFLKHILC